MLKDENEEITDDEWLYRRVHRTRFPQGNITTISDSAFEPRVKGDQPDHDGISLFRASCLENPIDILAKLTPEKAADNGIVRVLVSELKRIGLSVLPCPDEIKGHVVIPELSQSKFVSNKKKCQDSMHELARMASKVENVILRPSQVNI